MFANLRAFALTGVSINEEIIENISQLKNLEFLSFQETNINDNGLRFIKNKFGKLRYLNIYYTPVSGNAVIDFARGWPGNKLLHLRYYGPDKIHLQDNVLDAIKKACSDKTNVQINKPISLDYQ